MWSFDNQLLTLLFQIWVSSFSFFFIICLNDEQSIKKKKSFKFKNLMFLNFFPFFFFISMFDKNPETEDLQIKFRKPNHNTHDHVWSHHNLWKKLHLHFCICIFIFFYELIGIISKIFSWIMQPQVYVYENIV